MAADANRRIRVTAATQRNEAACRKTSVSVRAIDSSTRPIKEGSQLAPGADSEQSANGSRANRAMAGNNGKDEEARKGASRWSARKSCGSRKKSQNPSWERKDERAEWRLPMGGGERFQWQKKNPRTGGRGKVRLPLVGKGEYR